MGTIVPRDQRQRLPEKGHERTFWNDGNILYLDRSLDYPGECICQSSKKTLLEFVYFILSYFTQKGKKLGEQPVNIDL